MDDLLAYANTPADLPVIQTATDVTLVIQKLISAGILKPATGKFRKASLFQADAVLDLLEFGASAGPQTPPPEHLTENTRVVGSRCGAPTPKGPCGNRVAPGEQCWRHRDRPHRARDARNPAQE